MKGKVLQGIAGTVLAVAAVGVLVGPRLLAHPPTAKTADTIDAPSPSPADFYTPTPSPSPDPSPSPSPTDSSAPVQAPAPPPPAQAPAPPAIDHLALNFIVFSGQSSFTVTVREFPQDRPVGGACGTVTISATTDAMGNTLPTPINDTYRGCTSPPPQWSGQNYDVFAASFAHAGPTGAPFTWSASFSFSGVSASASGKGTWPG